VGAGHPAALVGGIHHVVVVQRAEVGHLERGRAEDDVVVGSLAELSGDEGEHGAHALAARVVEVAAGGVGDLVGDAKFALEGGVDPGQPGLHGRGEPTGPRPRECAVGEAQLARDARARR
jgi:hypothetical protein